MGLAKETNVGKCEQRLWIPVRGHTVFVWLTGWNVWFYGQIPWRVTIIHWKAVQQFFTVVQFVILGNLPTLDLALSAVKGLTPSVSRYNSSKVVVVLPEQADYMSQETRCSVNHDCVWTRFPNHRQQIYGLRAFAPSAMRFFQPRRRLWTCSRPRSNGHQPHHI